VERLRIDRTTILTVWNDPRRVSIFVSGDDAITSDVRTQVVDVEISLDTLDVLDGQQVDDPLGLVA
jgi:hypothetical protein